MSISFQKDAKEKPKKEEHSAGSLLFGALLGGMTSEFGQMADLAMDAAEIGGELYTYQFEKQEQKRAANANSPFKLGNKKALGGLFKPTMEGGPLLQPEAPQTRYLNDMAFAPRNRRRTMAYGMAA